jgi:hypothetical protein
MGSSFRSTCQRSGNSLFATLSIFTKAISTYIGTSWSRGIVITSLPDTTEIGAMGREIESLQAIGWYFIMTRLFF